jgi:hypothetical protein
MFSSMTAFLRRLAPNVHPIRTDGMGPQRQAVRQMEVSIRNAKSQRACVDTADACRLIIGETPYHYQRQRLPLASIQGFKDGEQALPTLDP